MSGKITEFGFGGIRGLAGTALAAPASGVNLTDPGGLFGGLTNVQDLLEAWASGTLGAYLTSSGGEGHVIDTSHATLNGTSTWDLANGNVHPGTLTADTTITTVGWPASRRGWLQFKVTGDGASTPTFAGVTWITAAPGIIGSGEVLHGALWSDDTGTVIWGAVSGGLLPAGTYVLTTEGGQETINARGTLGATETVDPSDGNIITGTLDQDCTITLSAPTAGGGSSLEWWLAESGGSWTPTFSPTGGSFQWDGGVTPSFPASGTTFRLVTERVPGTTNDWIGNILGSGGTALTVEDEGTPLATAADTLDFVGAGVTASGVGTTKTITIPGGASALDDLSDVTIIAAAANDRLAYNGTVWVNSAAIWRPLMDGAGNVITDGATGEAVMALS